MSILDTRYANFNVYFAQSDDDLRGKVHYSIIPGGSGLKVDQAESMGSYLAGLNRHNQRLEAYVVATQEQMDKNLPWKVYQ